MSKDGTLLLHAAFNDTLVQEVKFPRYVELYPEIMNLRYPKVCIPFSCTEIFNMKLFVATVSTSDNAKVTAGFWYSLKL